MEVSGETLRYVIVIGLTPFWWPFLRELYREMNGALREDGGLLGRAKSPDEFRGYVSPLSSTPFREGRNAPRAMPPATGQGTTKERGPVTPPTQVRAGGFKRPFRDR